MPNPLGTFEIAEAAVAPVSGTVDGQTVTMRSIEEMQLAKQLQDAEDAAAGANAQGGPRSAWNMTRPAKAVLPGTTGRT